MSSKKQLSQAVICEAGEKLFARHGYSAVGIKMILDEVGIPKGSFYHYFKSKEAFAVAVLEQYFSVRFERFEQALKNNTASISSTIIESYDQEIEAMFDRDDASGCVIGNLFIEANEGLPDLQQKLHDIYERWFSLFVSLIEQGQNSGEFRLDVEASSMASMFWANWEGTVLRFHLVRDKQQFKKNIQDFVRLMNVPAERGL
ncbi:TetR/AcrR family transcriptional regulator [Vibrio kyushuensis]|uniref:TetR/AcrR family transcriptional regulator n=1 Tax=Vibrio kyushuensis TaxID=2910249 RepID=UPI003D0B1BBD